MNYCVVPEALADELYEKLVEHYRDDENMTVLIDRRKGDRRARHGGSKGQQESRVVRDRRRARVPGEFSPLAKAD